MMEEFAGYFLEPESRIKTYCMVVYDKRIQDINIISNEHALG